MPIRDKDLTARLTELVEEHGHQWKKIAPILASEGYRDKRGATFSDNYLRNRMKKQETANQEKRSKDSEHSERSEHIEYSEHGEPSEGDVRDLARAVISLLKDDCRVQEAMREVLSSVECTRQEQQHEMPPQPERVTDRRWEKLAGTCDCELVKLFHEKRRTLRLSVSQMLDYVLWNFFDKPQLSFQSERSEESEPQGDAS
ncbi:MAG: hypothetical protein V1792_18260 [Pseudomonadota bacterium]